ncbi:PepSY domain-containing protein [Salegentibacter mishustinae]|uniref:PepSY-associated TM helix domain-containing protein n=1 Tax=Salegentibacter mishustinae TaxID=270918 RepID=UPI001CE0572E|nr:PepSY-associated TM helix domain-containing protein [Salegentibacter mishustinae]UBZ07936.1 PepSY domain-containing protein [Salegentibacter mishustinae]
MSNRIYNILFHTHTISGIIISALLYIIFFTGSIAFLRDEISAWEHNKPIEENYFNTIDFDESLEKLEEGQNLYGRDITFSHRYFEREVNVSMTPSKDSTIIDQNRGRLSNYFFMDMESFEKKDYQSNYSLGEFFYRLHFFAQLNFFGRSGYLLSGVVAFFFLFAIITGVLVHWKKIISSFYTFRPGAKWKTIWTDAHVALGMIGLPYQFIFAVTGCYLMIGYTVMLPPVEKYLFPDEPREVGKILNLEEKVDDLDFAYNPIKEDFSINYFAEKTLKKWPDLKLSELKIVNYGDEHMYVKLSGSPGYDESLLGQASQTYRIADGRLIAERSINEPTSYSRGTFNLLRRLHYGDYGGYGLKLIYLVLGFVTCFVILSGVYIRLVARNKKSVSKSKRKFNNWLVTIYTSVCLSLLPITAIIFIVMKVYGESYVAATGGLRKDLIYEVFFWGWLVLSVLFTIKHENYFTNKFCLILGSFFGILVPIANGIMTGNWIWVSLSKGYTQIFVVDIFWILLSITAFIAVLRIKKKRSLRPA